MPYHSSTKYLYLHIHLVIHVIKEYTLTYIPSDDSIQFDHSTHSEESTRWRKELSAKGAADSSNLIESSNWAGSSNLIVELTYIVSWFWRFLILRRRRIYMYICIYIRIILYIPSYIHQLLILAYSFSCTCN